MSENKVLLPLLTDDLNIIQALSNRPNQTEPDDLSPDEFKAKFDAAGNAIKDYINNILIPNIIAGNVPFQSSSGNVTGTTVLEAIEWLKTQVAESQLGQIGDRTITEEKLTDDVANLLHRGVPHVSNSTPTSENYGVGKIWLHTSDGTATGTLKGLYIQITDAPRWWQYTFDTLPVGRGGTGLTDCADGDLLYGKNGALEKLSPPSADSFLHYGTKPEWKTKGQTKAALGYLNVATGTYTGTGKKGEIVLVPGGDGTETEGNGNAIEPAFICVYRKDGFYNGSSSYNRESSVCMCNGAEVYQEMFLGSVNCFITVGLRGSKLVFDNKTNTKDDALAALMNFTDAEYCWTALY